MRHDIRVEFAIDYEDADSMIEALIQQNATPQMLLVVSSDHRIQTAARRRKAHFIDSDVWIDQLEHPESKRKSPASLKSAKPRLDGDTQFWMDWLRAEELDAAIDEGNDVNETAKSSSDESESDREEFFNPFPKGYGEDLLDDN